MRLSNLSLLLGVVSRVAATLPPVIEDEDDGVEPTIFNGKSVPPVLELTPKNWEEKLKASKFLMVKHFRYGISPLPFSSSPLPPLLPPFPMIFD